MDGKNQSYSNYASFGVWETLVFGDWGCLTKFIEEDKAQKEIQKAKDVKDNLKGKSKRVIQKGNLKG